MQRSSRWRRFSAPGARNAGSSTQVWLVIAAMRQVCALPKPISQHTNRCRCGRTANPPHHFPQLVYTLIFRRLLTRTHVVLPRHSGSIRRNFESRQISRVWLLDFSRHTGFCAAPGDCPRPALPSACSRGKPGSEIKHYICGSVRTTSR